MHNFNLEAVHALEEKSKGKCATVDLVCYPFVAFGDTKRNQQLTQLSVRYPGQGQLSFKKPSSSVVPTAKFLLGLIHMIEFYSTADKSTNIGNYPL